MSKSEGDKWVAKKAEIDTIARWLREGEDVEVIYGEFEEVKTKREDKKTGRSYETNDFKIAVRLAGGKTGFRLVNAYVFSDIIAEFQKSGMPKSLLYRRSVRRV